jgi:undecaprenyl-diphosphatase
MNFFQSFLLGVIEGLTEFLPISSTAHLILISKILKIESNDFLKFFEIFIQSGAILAIIILYFKKIFSSKKIIFFIFTSFIVTSLIGVLFYKTIKRDLFENLRLIIFNLWFLGVVFIILEELINRGKIHLNKTLQDLSIKEALLIGLFQGLSIMPGISRAGSVILGMMILGYKREDSVTYSFFISVPTIISAGLFDFYKSGINQVFLSSQNLFFLITGFLSAFLAAILVINWFIKYLQKNNLKIFGYYRILFAIFIYFYLFFYKS